MKSKFMKSLCVLLSFIMAFSTVAFASEISDFSEYSEYSTDAENAPDYADYTDYAEDADYAEDTDYTDYIGIEPYLGINVTFNANGGSLLPGNTTRQTMANNTIGAGNMPISPTRGGFVFVHWNTAPGGGGAVFTGTTPVTAPITVYAQWGFEVRFYGNGVELTAGTNPNLSTHFLPRNVMANSTANATPGIVWPSNPSRPGFVFQGWFNTYAPTGGTQFTGATQINSSVALFARWTPAPTHTVTFNPQGGTIAAPHTATRQVPGGANINQAWALGHNTATTWPRSAPLATRPDMTLEGWWTGLNGTGTRWAPPGAQHTGTGGAVSGGIPAASVGFSNTVVNGPVTVNAHWVYRVLFRTNATGTPTSAFARDIPIGVAGATINTHGRAIPVPASTVQGALSGMPANPTQAGATFMGWFLADSFAAAQTGGTPFTGDTVITSNTTVWARWQTAAPAIVTFQADGGTFTGGVTTQTRSVATGATLTQANMPAIPTHAGHVFMGWYVAGQYPQQGVHNRFTFNTTVSTPITVYARWSPYVTVTFRTTAQGTATDVTRNFPPGFTFGHMDTMWFFAGGGNRFLLVDSALRRAMPATFTFIGWSTEPDGGGSRFTTSTVVTENITVYSAWTIPITFNNNHPAAGAETVQRRVAYGESVTSSHALPVLHVGRINEPIIPDVTDIRIQREQINWPTTDPTSSAHFVMGGGNLLDYFFPMYLQWTALNVHDWAFLGFNTAANGSGTWADSRTVFTQPTTLFAQWGSGIAFHPGVAPSEIIAPENAYRVRPPVGQSLGDAWPPDPTWQGKTFHSWNARRDGAGMTYDRDTNIMFARTLFAIWNASVTFNANGGVLSGPATSEIIAGVPIGGAMPPDPTRYGFAFTGWNTATDGSGTTYTATAPVITAQTTLFAQWQWLGDGPYEPGPGEPGDFFYIVNYARETISFGNTFTVLRRPVVDHLSRPLLDVNRNIQWESVEITNVRRSQISFIFNRRPDRIRTNRGRWTPTITGEVDMSRHLRRGGYVGVRRRLPTGEFELIGIIELYARPPHRDIRAHRRDIYVPSRLDHAGGYLPGQFLHNPTDELIEIRLGNDRNIFSRANLTTERLAPGESFAMRHDTIPRGMRGTYRIAPNEKNNFVLVNGVYTCVRYLLLRGYTEVNGEALDLGEGNFGSAQVRFRFPNQPTAPASANMRMTAGRNGTAWFVSRTNAHMRVLLGHDDDDNPVWAQLEPNITISRMIELFGDDWPLPKCETSDDYYSFEIRFFRNNRIVSAPGFLTVDAAQFHENTNVSAAFVPIVISGTQGDSDINRSRNPLNSANGIALRITTSGGQITMPATTRTAQNRADVSSWFVDADGYSTLPEGLTATLTRVQGANATVTIHGIPEEYAVNMPVVMQIPASAIEGGTAVWVVNATDSANVDLYVARFNIAPAVSVSVTTPAAIDISPSDGSYSTED